MTNAWQINSMRFSKFVAARSIISRGTGFDEKSRTVCRLRIKSIDADELLKYAGRQLTSYKRLCEIVVLDVLPAASTGKILKHKLWETARAAKVRAAAASVETSA